MRRSADHHWHFVLVSRLYMTWHTDLSSATGLIWRETDIFRKT